MEFAKSLAKTAARSAVSNLTGRAIGKVMGRRKGYSKADKALARRVSKLERGFNRELKTFDATRTTSPTTTGGVQNLNVMGQGDTSLQRDGLQIKPKHLTWKIRIKNNASASTGTFVRMILFTDREGQGSYATATDLLESDDIDAWPEHNTRPRFKIHKSIVYRVEPATSSPHAIYDKGIIKFPKNYKMWYNGSAAAEASVGKNALYVYLVSDQATNSPAIEFNSRLRFVDN